MLDKYPLFDSHMHIIDYRFPLIANNGYLPPEFKCDTYLEKLSAYQLCGGVVVSGSFQAFDQHYLISALQQLGSAFVGVTQLPISVSDEEIQRLNGLGIKAIRFNLKRGGSAEVEHLSSMAARVHEIANWHVELYVDAKDIQELSSTLATLPSVSVDHLGLSEGGLHSLISLAEKGVKVKASGFSRADFDISKTLKAFYSANPNCLMFGSDLPSTRAPQPYSDNDFILVAETLGESAAMNVFSENAIEFYRIVPSQDK